jgi:hypothetical protein
MSSSDILREVQILSVETPEQNAALSKPSFAVAYTFSGTPAPVPSAPLTPSTPAAPVDDTRPTDLSGVDFILRLLDFPYIKSLVEKLPFPKAERSINFFIFMIESHADFIGYNAKAIATILYAADNNVLDKDGFTKLVRRVVGTSDNLMEGVHEMISAPHMLGGDESRSFSKFDSDFSGYVPRDSASESHNKIASNLLDHFDYDDISDEDDSQESTVERKITLWKKEAVIKASSSRDQRDSALMASFLDTHTKQIHVPNAQQIEDLLGLKDTMPNFSVVVDFIYEQLLLGGHSRLGAFTFPPILLGGAPGIGKTLFSQTVCQILGFPDLLVIPCGLENASFALGGSNSTWGGATPGTPAKMMRDAKHANIVILLDEIDKFSQGRGNGGDPFAALYQLLEPANSWRFMDQYLLFPINFSLTNWILTANDITAIPEPILDRTKYFLVASPEKDQMATKIIPSVYDRVLVEKELEGAFSIHLPDETVSILVECGTPRDVRHILIEALGRAAKRLKISGSAVKGVLPEILPIDLGSATRIKGKNKLGF